MYSISIVFIAAIIVSSADGFNSTCADITTGGCRRLVVAVDISTAAATSESVMAVRRLASDARRRVSARSLSDLKNQSETKTNH